MLLWQVASANRNRYSTALVTVRRKLETIHVTNLGTSPDATTLQYFSSGAFDGLPNCQTLGLLTSEGRSFALEGSRIIDGWRILGCTTGEAPGVPRLHGMEVRTARALTG